jgi:hypothetical protein
MMLALMIAVILRLVANIVLLNVTITMLVLKTGAMKFWDANMMIFLKTAMMMTSVL